MCPLPTLLSMLKLHAAPASIVVYLCLDMSAYHMFHFCTVHACTVFFVHMWYKKMPNIEYTFNH
jgi:hypothetical protein